jgi:hypothetical protein
VRTVAQVLAPARQLLVLAAGVVEHRLVVGEVVELGVLDAAVAGADEDPVLPERTSSLVMASAVIEFRRAA